MRPFVLSLCLLLVTPAISSAQLAPEIGYAVPAGAQVGTTVEVTLGGYDWTPDMQLFVHDPRIKLELLGPPTEVLITEPPYWFGAKARGYAWPLPREFKARLTVPADVPPGFVNWQVANANGVSPVGRLHLSPYPEVVESPGSEGPQPLPALPVVVSGQIRRIEEIDRYRLRPTQSGLITIDLLARQLTAPTNPMALHGMLQVTDDAGRRLVDVAATEGLDLTQTFAVEANRDYVISLHDVDFAGDRSYAYRLVITPGPGPVVAFPSAGRRGETRSVEFCGIGLATGAPVLETITRDVSFPAEPGFTELNYVLDTPHGKSHPLRLLVSDAPELTEGTPFAELPAAMTGRLETRFGSDSYPVTLKKGDVWRIAARSCAAPLPLDLDLVLLNAAGKEVATADDVPGTTDPELLFTVAEDGIHTVRISDRSGRSGLRTAAYRLSFDSIKEDVVFTVPDLLAIPLGTTGKLIAKVVRQGNFKGPVTLSVKGLLTGVTPPGNLTIAEGQNELVIDVVCPATAAATASLVSVEATMTLNGAQVTRPIKTLVIASIMNPRIKITPEGLDDVSKVHRGSTFRFPLLIERLEGYAGPLTLEMTAKQQRHRQGLASDELVVPADVTRVEYPIFVPEWMETTKTSRMILNGRVDLADPQGNVRTLLQRMQLRLGILPEGALMKLAHAPAEYQASRGGTVAVPLTISRTPDFREPVTIELVLTDPQTGIVSAAPISLSATDQQTALTLRFADAPSAVGEHRLLIRATADQPGRGMVRSETTVTVDIGNQPVP
jgi:hypothetical protein